MYFFEVIEMVAPDESLLPRNTVGRAEMMVSFRMGRVVAQNKTHPHVGVGGGSWTPRWQTAFKIEKSSSGVVLVHQLHPPGSALQTSFSSP